MRSSPPAASSSSTACCHCRSSSDRCCRWATREPPRPRGGPGGRDRAATLASRRGRGLRRSHHAQAVDGADGGARGPGLLRRAALVSKGAHRRQRGGGCRRSCASSFLRPRHLGWACGEDRKSTRLNSSHSQISYAVFCLKKKNRKERESYDAQRSRSVMNE